MALQYMTQEGLDKLKKELAEAIAQRPVISAAIAEARDKGDLSESGCECTCYRRISDRYRQGADAQ